MIDDKIIFKIFKTSRHTLVTTKISCHTLVTTKTSCHTLVTTKTSCHTLHTENGVVIVTKIF